MPWPWATHTLEPSRATLFLRVQTQTEAPQRRCLPNRHTGSVTTLAEPLYLRGTNASPIAGTLVSHVQEPPPNESESPFILSEKWTCRRQTRCGDAIFSFAPAWGHPLRSAATARRRNSHPAGRRALPISGMCIQRKRRHNVTACRTHTKKEPHHSQSPLTLEAAPPVPFPAQLFRTCRYSARRVRIAFYYLWETNMLPKVAVWRCCLLCCTC